MLSRTPRTGPAGQVQLHASTVVIHGRAIAFLGPSGSGKSSHALAMMARGAALLADDVTWLERSGDDLMAICPPALSGKIECRGVGILNAAPASSAPLRLIVDLGTPEKKRLPDPKTVSLQGCEIELLHRVDSSCFIDAIVHYTLHGRAL